MPITKEQLQLLRNTVISPGWQEVYSPDLDRERIQAVDILLRSRTERPEPKYSDDFLRGYIKGLSYAAGRPFVLVRESELATADEFRRSQMEVSDNGVGSPYANETP